MRTSLARPDNAPFHLRAGPLTTEDQRRGVTGTAGDGARLAFVLVAVLVLSNLFRGGLTIEIFVVEAFLCKVVFVDWVAIGALFGAQPLMGVVAITPSVLCLRFARVSSTSSLTRLSRVG